MLHLPTEHLYDVIPVLNNTSKNLEDLLNIVDIYFPSLVIKIYSNDVQLNKAGKLS